MDPNKRPLTRIPDAAGLAPPNTRSGKASMQDEQDPETYPLFALLPPGHHQAPKVRAFIDFLIERLGSAPWRTSARRRRERL
jgi:DNA-binding transcriptional LysR family regulator